MSSTNQRRAKQADRYVGIGGPGNSLMMRFVCARCTQPGHVAGRRLQRIGGVKRWVCKGCAK